MIDGALMAKLLDAVDPKKRIVFLGDKDQLASVEAGSVFGDLCNAAFTKGSVIENHIIHLTKSHRFNPEKGIGLFSRSVLEGDTSCVQQFTDNPDQELSIDTRYSQTAFEDYIKRVPGIHPGAGYGQSIGKAQPGEGSLRCAGRTLRRLPHQPPYRRLFDRTDPRE